MDIDRFLVVTRVGDNVSASMEYADWILRYIDMMDCFEYDEIHVYDVRNIGHIEELELHSAWWHPDDPLWLEVVDSKGNLVFGGYGTDH